MDSYFVLWQPQPPEQPLQPEQECFPAFFCLIMWNITPPTIMATTTRQIIVAGDIFRHFLLFYALCIFSLDSAETVLISRLISLSHHHVDEESDKQYCYYRANAKGNFSGEESSNLVHHKGDSVSKHTSYMPIAKRGPLRRCASLSLMAPIAAKQGAHRRLNIIKL